MLRFARYFLRRGAAWLRRHLVPPLPPRSQPEVLPYSLWMQQRLSDRRQDYPAVERRGLFSILTPVFDPPAGFFRILGSSILGQEHRDLQWVVVDNGCTRPDVLYLLEKFARDPRVRLVRAGTPRGIIGGMRLALEHATGEYLCPVDHDDRLYPDALRVVAAALEARGWPRIAYTDEDKLLPSGKPGLPFLKPSWDPLLFLNCCYVAHLGVLHRETALALGVYTDPQAEGTPDGDAFCRFVAAGHTPVHLPEIVYSWRMHPESTALLGIEAKPYVTASQKHSLGRYLDQRKLSHRITLRTNTLHGMPGTWRVCPVRRTSRETFPVFFAPGGTRDQRRTLGHRLALCDEIDLIHRLGADRHALADAVASVADDAWLVMLDPLCLPVSTDFVREFQAVRDACPDAAWVGGTILTPHGRVRSAGLVWGFEDILGCPVRNTRPGRGLGDVLLFQRSVSAVDPGFCLIRAGLLREALRHADGDLADPLLPAWLAALARERGRRVLFTPHAVARLQASRPARRPSAEATHRFLTRYGGLLRADPYYSRYWGLTRTQAYQAVSSATRARALERLLCGLADSHPSYRDWCGDLTRYAMPAEHHEMGPGAPDSPPLAA